MSNIPQLREFFLDGTYKAFESLKSLLLGQVKLNVQAHKTQGKLAESFASLLDLMWRKDTTKAKAKDV